MKINKIQLLKKNTGGTIGGMKGGMKNYELRIKNYELRINR